MEEVRDKVGQAIEDVAQPAQSRVSLPLQISSVPQVSSTFFSTLVCVSSPQDLTVRQLAQQVRSMEEHISLLQEELSQFSATATSTTNTMEYSRGTREVQVRYTVQWGQEDEVDEHQLLAQHRYSSEESLMAASSPSKKWSGPVSITSLLFMKLFWEVTECACAKFSLPVSRCAVVSEKIVHVVKVTPLCNETLMLHVDQGGGVEGGRE